MLSKEELTKLGSTDPIKFMKEAVDDFKKYTGKILGLSHIRPSNIKYVIKHLKKFEKEHPDATVAAFIFYKD